MPSATDQKSVSLANVTSLDRRSLPVILRAFSDGVETVTESGKAAFVQTAIFTLENSSKKPYPTPLLAISGSL